MNFLLKISGSGNRFLLADKRYFCQSQAPKQWKDPISTSYAFEDFLMLAKKTPSQRESFLKTLMTQAPLMDGLIVLDSTNLGSTNLDSTDEDSEDLDFVDFVVKKSRDAEKQLQDSEEKKRAQKKQGQKKLLCSFYNKDGSLASMCGNAACCLSFYIEELSLGLKKFFFEQQEIPIAQKGGIVITKSIKNPLNFSETLLSFSEPLAFSFIDTGVPHGVVECSQLDFTDPKSLLKTIALKLRTKNINSYREGMNVSFYQVLSKNKLKAITFERGVEDWTLACGTGALAVSLVYLSKQKKSQQENLRIEMPGGSLKVEKGDRLKLFSEVKKSF